MRWLWVLLLLGGCATYSNQSARIREELLRGDVEKALAEIPLEKHEDDVLVLLERGLLLFESGQYEESFALFTRADQRIEELYTKSISREAFAFLSNDQKRPYEGMAHEQVLLHLYAALDMMALGRDDDALVEIRRVGLRLDKLAEARVESERYRYDGFAEWLAAILYAEDDDANGAMVSFRRALRAYETEAESGGIAPPVELIHDHIRAAERFGFAQEATDLRERYPDAAATMVERSPGEGEVILLYESGMISSLVEERVDFPILESDDKDRGGELAPVLVARGGRTHYVVPKNQKVDYWLSIALPVLQPHPTHWTHARARAGDHTAQSFPVHDLSATAQLLFEEGSGTRLLRTVTRALVKYTATKAVKKKNEGLGTLTDILTSISERADTRSWSTLPDRIHMLRLRLPEGEHEVLLEVLDTQGQVAQTATYEAVQVLPGRITLLQHRSYR